VDAHFKIARSMGLQGAEPIDLCSGSDHVVSLVIARPEREGRTFNDRRAWTARVEGDRITEVWVHPFDQYGLDEFYG